MPEPSISLFVTIRAPLSQTLAFVYYHLNIGVDKLYIFFDDPDDPAADMLEKERRVTCFRCTPRYWAELPGNLFPGGIPINEKQKMNSRVALERARKDGFEWICHLDGDELVYAPGGLKQTIAVLPQHVQVAKFPVLEVIPDMGMVQSAFQDLCYFKNAPMVYPTKKFFYMDGSDSIMLILNMILYKAKIALARLSGCKQVSRDYIKAHTMGKSIARTSAPIAMFYSHFPVPVNQQRLRINIFPKCFVLHYDSPDYVSWKTKWHQKYVSNYDTGVPERYSPRRKLQYEEYVRIYEHGNENDLVDYFKSTFLFSPSEQVRLRRIGLLSDVHLDPELFEKSV